MLAPGTEMFLFIPNGTNQRVLHPGKVLESSAKHFVAVLEDDVRPVVGADVCAYADVKGKFFQQTAIVTALVSESATPTIALSRVGQPVSAESRQVFRVNTVTANIMARLEDEKQCRTVDMSPVGLAVIAAEQHNLGSTVQVSLAYEGQTIATAGRVQTIKPRPDGAFRYGLLASQDDGAALRALQQISGGLQRKQLRRLAGAA